MRLSLGLVAAIAACAAPVGAQAATVRGKLKSLPAPAKRFSATARAVDADTALVLSDQQIRSGRRYRLTVPSGPLIVAADALPTSGHALHGASGLVVAGGKGPDRANVPLGRAAKAGGGPVYRLGSVPIDAASGARIPDLDIAPLVLRLLLDDCDGTATRFVDDSGFVRRRLEHEQRLSDKGQTEVRLHYKPLAAGFEVHGHGTAGKNGSFALDLQLVDLTTKLVVAHSSVHGTFAHADALVEQAAAKLAGSDCTPPGPDAEPTPTPTPVPTPLPTATPVPTQTAEPTSAPTATPSPTAGPGSCPNGAGLQSAADASQTVTLGAGCVIKPTQPIVVAPGKTLTIVAADGAKIDGQHVTQLFRVSAGATLDVTGLVLQSGQAEGASGGHVQPADPADPGEPGTNGAPGDEGQPGAKGGPATNGEDAELSAPAIDGGDGRGGAIEDAGTLACHDCTFSGNEADGGTGGDGTDARMGGHGGDGGGGGNGGYGRPGARGGDGGSGGDGGEGAKGTDGGDGGAGLGGALYVAPGASAQLSGSSFTGNSVYGGPGGRGAAGGFGGEGGQGGIGGVGGGGHVGNFGTGGAGAAGGNGGTGGNGGKGGDGGDGGSGGPGEGGAIFNDGGTLTITGGAFTGNTAYGLYGGHGGFAGRGGGVADNENGGGAGRLGGYGGYGGCPDDNLNCGAAGGPGGDGGNGGHGGDAGSTGNGGANGDGGDGVGGAIFSTVALAPAGTTFMSNFVAAGFAHGNGCENTGAIDCPGTADYFGLGGDGGPAGAGQQGGPGAGGGPMGAHGHDGVKGADGEDGEEGETGDFGTAGVAADADIHAPSPRAEPGRRVALH